MRNGGIQLAAVFCAVIAADPVQAGPDRASVLLGSHHVNASRNFEEANPGLFLTWSGAMWQNRLDLGFGAFRNSYGDGSLAVTTAWPIARHESWGIDLFGALAWYPGNGGQFSHALGDMVPLAGVQARYRNLFMQAIPSGGNTADAVISFGLTFGLE